MVNCLYKWPGPLWEPNVWDGIYPLTAEPGDIYVNRFTTPALYYLFTTKDHCKMIDREEIKEWVHTGLMKLPPVPVPTKKQPSKNLGMSLEKPLTG